MPKERLSSYLFVVKENNTMNKERMGEEEIVDTETRKENRTRGGMTRYL